jgi:hypothetical protein
MHDIEYLLIIEVVVVLIVVDASGDGVDEAKVVGDRSVNSGHFFLTAISTPRCDSNLLTKNEFFVK